jgi:choline dehydrogenase-like flavoprotein
MADFIIIGGGLAGCVVASRLHERRPHLEITLVEAGPDTKGMPHVDNPAEGALLHGSDLDYKYMTTEQMGLDGRMRYNCGVKGLGGGTVINYGTLVEGRGEKMEKG